MRWITREHPKIDRVACPWLITRFIDQDAEFIFVPAANVDEQAALLDATPFDVEGVELSHEGPLCSFDAFLKKYQIENEALSTIAKIVRGADTARLAVSLGLSRLFVDDHEMIRHGFVMYDALYAWCLYASDETHQWNPQRSRLTA
jgi:hypothetical protein